MSKTKLNNFKGENLKKALKCRKMTHEKFAEELGVSTQTVTYWITNKKKPTSKNFDKFEKILNIMPEYFLGSSFLCSKEEFNKISERFEQTINEINASRPFYNFLLSVGEKYKTFNFECLDKEFSSKYNDLIYNLVKKDLEQYIEFIFFKYGVISDIEKI